MNFYAFLDGCEKFFAYLFGGVFILGIIVLFFYGGIFMIFVNRQGPLWFSWIMGIFLLSEGIYIIIYGIKVFIDHKND